VDARLQRRVQRYGWDKAAAHYDRFWQRQLQPARALLLERAALRPGERVLDLACGTGVVTFAAAQAVGGSGEVVGTDISDEMVAACRRAAASGGVAHARFERMEAETISFPDDSFDVVLCALGLMYVTDFEGTVREMHRVLKPGGRAAAAVWGRRDRCGWADIFPIVESRVQSEVCPLFFQLGTGDLLATVFRNAGLADAASDRLSTTLAYDTGEDACGAAFAGGPVAMAYSRFDEAAREGAHADYLKSIAPFRENGAYRIPGEFVVTRGSKRKGGSS
jgi:ubiquinone/menaquinone biosynthesis C-methylase UbiE